MSSKTRKVELEVALGTVGRLRILKELASRPNQPITKYQLEKLTGLKPVDVRKDLEALIQIGWVKEHPYRPKKYEINTENQKAKHLTEFFQKMEYK